MLHLFIRTQAATHVVCFVEDDQIPTRVDDLVSPRLA